MNKKFLIPILVLSLLLTVPLFQYSAKPEEFPPKQGIPFVGMSMVFYGVDWEGNTDIQTICVLKYNSTTNTVTIRDSMDACDLMEVDVATREVIWSTGEYELPFYVDCWIPTDIKIGSVVWVMDYDAVTIGDTQFSVCGKAIDVWILQGSRVIDEYGTISQCTWYFEKKTGLRVGGIWIVYDSEGRVIMNWGGHLVSTNVPL